MNLPKLAIDRPVFVSCVVILLMVLGYMAYRSLGVDLFPDVSFPFVSVTTSYKGAAPEEIETQISKPIEEQISTLEGVKKVYSVNQEGFSIVTVQFTLETDSKDAEQRVRDKMSFVRPQLPKDIDEPVIQRLDPSDSPIMILSLQSGLTPSQAYDIVDQVIKPQLSQVTGVGVVDIIGGLKREIRVELDRSKLNAYRISATSVANNIGLNGMNVPVGKFQTNGSNMLFRSVGEYNDLNRLRHTVVNFLGSDVPITVDKVGKVVDTTVDPPNYSFLNGQPALFLLVHKQSKANTVAVVNGVFKTMDRLNDLLKTKPGAPKIGLVREDGRIVKMNLDDVQNTIGIGIFLTVLVVFFFLGSFRSTLITITSLPVSLLGSFILMNSMGFTLNLMTLLALSLAVGLLIDDAIVVRENIWRHIENGEEPKTAALNGTLEVAMAVVATTSVIIAVFLPIAFLKGTVGQFFKQFGMTVCFAMAVSLFEAMVMGPMLSAYWAKKSTGKHDKPKGILKWFDDLQTGMEKGYEVLIGWSIKHRLIVVIAAVLIFIASLGLTKFIKFTFLPGGDNGEFRVTLKLPPSTSLETTRDASHKVIDIISKHKEVLLTSETIGDTQGNDNTSTIYAKLTPWQTRKLSTSDLKDIVRKELEPYREQYQPQVADYDLVNNAAPFNLVLVGDDYKTLEPIANDMMAKIKNIPGLADLQTNYDGNKPEFQAVLDPVKLRQLGVLGIEAGNELHTQVEGSVPAKFRQNGLEYDIRVRMQEDQRNLQQDFKHVWVPNSNHLQVRLTDIAEPVTTVGPSKINRLNRARYIQISGQLGPGGALGNITSAAEKIVKEANLPPGVSYNFVGQAEDLGDLVTSMLTAVGLALLFTYMILASLYESPILPFTIMMSIPLSIVGAFIALAVTGQTLNIFSMIALIMLMGLVTKNAILLVDYIVQMEKKGVPRNEAIRQAGVIRLRPIVMTTLALIAGMIPTALALTEVGKFRQSMGVAIIGGLISSLFLTLIIVPSVYGYVDDFRLWLRKIFIGDEVKVSKK
ncbi:MAG TPA: efflux RND transporter permease subunit [bacterium]|jgi:HAE1 family hydrophobic/amphiphilic exporter-1|nr:efflux RND transporter permease subunit [bacterium]